MTDRRKISWETSGEKLRELGRKCERDKGETNERTSETNGRQVGVRDKLGDNWETNGRQLEKTSETNREIEPRRDKVRSGTMPGKFGVEMGENLKQNRIKLEDRCEQVTGVSKWKKKMIKLGDMRNMEKKWPFQGSGDWKTNEAQMGKTSQSRRQLKSLKTSAIELRQTSQM